MKFEMTRMMVSLGVGRYRLYSEVGSIFEFTVRTQSILQIVDDKQIA